MFFRAFLGTQSNTKKQAVFLENVFIRKTQLTLKHRALILPVPHLRKCQICKNLARKKVTLQINLVSRSSKNFFQ